MDNNELKNETVNNTQSNDIFVDNSLNNFGKTEPSNNISNNTPIQGAISNSTVDLSNQTLKSEKVDTIFDDTTQVSQNVAVEPQTSTVEIKPTVTEPIPEVKQKKSKGPIVAIILLILIVLGLGGYICYDKFIANKDDTKQNETQEESKNEEEAVQETSEQLISVNLDTYVDSEIHSIGTVKVAENEYEVKYKQSNDASTGNFKTSVMIGDKEFALSRGVDCVAVMDDKYIYIKGNSNLVEWDGDILIIDKNLNDVTKNLGVTIDSYRWYQNMDSEYNVTGDGVNVELGYVDSHNIKTGKCNVESGSQYQEYYQYLITFKDGQVSEKILKHESPVFCTSQGQ